MNAEMIKSILSEITNQLKEGAPTNQNILCEGYIPLKSYDSGYVTQFAIIEKTELFPESIVELGFDHDNYEFYAYDKDQNFVFDVLLEDVVSEEQITKFIIEFEKYYLTYINN